VLLTQQLVATTVSVRA